MTFLARSRNKYLTPRPESSILSTDMRDIEQTEQNGHATGGTLPAGEDGVPSYTYKTVIIRPSAVKAHARLKGRRVSAEAMRYLDEYIQRKLTAACGIHDGGRKTIGANLLAHVGIK